MGVLYIRDQSGNFVPIPVISGKDGRSAYQYAVEGGYTGTEAEFAVKLAEEVYSKEETDAAISKATKEGQWELIEETTLKESVERFYRDVEPDGTPYNYKAVVIKADFQGVTSEYASSTYGVLANNYDVYCYCASKKIGKNDSLWGIIDNGGYTPYVNCCTLSNSGMSLVSNFTGLINSTYRNTNFQARPIRNITISGLLPEGVKISIKGVRA